MPTQIDNIIIQVRARLNSFNIRLWLEPYYYDGIGVVESELEQLAQDFSKNLSISPSNCKLALSELQDGALRKLAARKEFEQTGLATFSVRRVSNKGGTENIFEVKCALSDLGEELQKKVADKLDITEPGNIKIICQGKIVHPKSTLLSQGLKNNQQLMAIASEPVNNADRNSEAMYDRVRKIKEDVEYIVSSGHCPLEMEDQDGNPVYMPPEENKAILMAMGFCEKARAAIKREQYDEALILLLEADERFSSCNSKFLDSVDNYALVNLDIVWCYLCLRNLTQLPDAERRLDICERNFNRCYGKDLDRLIYLKGDPSPERALIMRLHLLQGVLMFHQNRRDEAYEKLERAKMALEELKVDETLVTQLLDMGYEASEARIALRASKGDITSAINFIHERKNKINQARKKSRRDRKTKHNLERAVSSNEFWVNPKNVRSLIDMGFSWKLVVVALRKTNNDMSKALDMLQSNPEELVQALSTDLKDVDEKLLEELQEMGFDEDAVKVALEINGNNAQKAISFLLKTFNTQEELEEKFNKLSDPNQASTSTGASNASGLIDHFLVEAKKELDSMKAFERFNADISGADNEYLDLTLVQEEQFLIEYLGFLGQ